MDEIAQEILAQSSNPLVPLGHGLVALERDFTDLFHLLTRLNESKSNSFLAPATESSTAVAVPASRSHAAEDPQTVAVAAPHFLPEKANS